MTLDKTAKIKAIMIELLKYLILCFFAFWTFVPLFSCFVTALKMLKNINLHL